MVFATYQIDGNMFQDFRVIRKPLAFSMRM